MNNTPPFQPADERPALASVARNRQRQLAKKSVSQAEETNSSTAAKQFSSTTRAQTTNQANEGVQHRFSGDAIESPDVVQRQEGRARTITLAVACAAVIILCVMGSFLLNPVGHAVGFGDQPTKHLALVTATPGLTPSPTTPSNEPTPIPITTDQPTATPTTNQGGGGTNGGTQPTPQPKSTTPPKPTTPPAQPTATAQLTATAVPTATAQPTATATPVSGASANVTFSATRQTPAIPAVSFSNCGSSCDSSTWSGGHDHSIEQAVNPTGSYYVINGNNSITADITCYAIGSSFCTGQYSVTVSSTNGLLTCSFNYSRSATRDTSFCSNPQAAGAGNDRFDWSHNEYDVQGAGLLHLAWSIHIGASFSNTTITTARVDTYNGGCNSGWANNVINATINNERQYIPAPPGGWAAYGNVSVTGAPGGPKCSGMYWSNTINHYAVQVIEWFGLNQPIYNLGGAAAWATANRAPSPDSGYVWVSGSQQQCAVQKISDSPLTFSCAFNNWQEVYDWNGGVKAQFANKLGGLPINQAKSICQNPAGAGIAGIQGTCTITTVPSNAVTMPPSGNITISAQ